MRLATGLLAMTTAWVLAPPAVAQAPGAQVLHFGDETIDAASPVSPLVESARKPMSMAVIGAETGTYEIRPNPLRSFRNS